ncbi:MAG: thiolase family protein [Dehalococcoidia bacterium]|uniref:thiolase family protein n=1 Tax=Candidatus Amarobacter glycogenicus TaxID=3140699 RepID=UPI002A0F53CB|nr:thiolase family protein [Dehalococcoidia bacterium]MBK9545113.1 thiolase family protein [Dehalococcoidia bacterium]MBK9611099.1 thiolase family protein [Dehalococcoidia bacterium]
MSLRGKAAIAGIGEFRPSRYTEGATTLGMLAEVGMQAVADAGLEMKDIDGLVTESFAESPMFAPATMVEYLGIDAKFAEVVDHGGATGAAMVLRAAMAISSGLCDRVLCVTAARRERRSNSGERSSASTGWAGRRTDRTPYSEFEVPYGAIGANYGYAMIAQRYMYEYGVKPEQLAEIAVAQRYNACHNPEAIFFGQPITVEDVLNSPVVVDPLHMLEIVMPVAGAAALVVTGARTARKLKHDPVYVLGAGEHTTHRSITYAPSLTHSPITAAADAAFKMAGVRRKHIDIASIYDCYTITVLVSLEDAGFAKKGRGGKFVEEHNLRFDGDFPLNPHGGQLSFGQAGLAGGMSHVTEAARQLMGRAKGRQVKKPDFAFVNGNGGIMSEQVSLILGRDR